MWFDIIKQYFSKGYYNEAKLKSFVVANYITEDEYRIICGKKYYA